MTLLFDTKVEFLNSDNIATIACWHLKEPIFALACYSQELSGSVVIYADTGEAQQDISRPSTQNAIQCTAMAWHPERILLVTGWENGEMHVWFVNHREFAGVSGPHKAPIIIVEFSEQGGRMVTGDTMGLLTGWRCDGQYQFLTMFTHDLRDVFVHVTFRRTINSVVREEMINLARAAVAGDERALDALTNWRPRTAIRSITQADVKDNYCFFIYTQVGLLYYVNQIGACSEVSIEYKQAITQMIWHPNKYDTYTDYRDAVICLMEDMTVLLYLVESTGQLSELDRVKLSGKFNSSRNGAITWVGSSLAIITGDLFVRIWDIETSDNYLLKMDLPSKGLQTTPEIATTSLGYFNSSSNGSSSLTNHLYASNPQSDALTNSNEYFTCIAYISCNHSLCAGTNQGNLYTWKQTSGGGYSSTSEDRWLLTNISNIHGLIKQVVWGYNELAKPCILINCVSNVYILKEQQLLAAYTRNLSAIQQSARKILLEYSDGTNYVIHADFGISALALANNHLSISDGRNISTYKMTKVHHQQDTNNGYDIFSNTTPSSNKINKELIVKSIQTFSAECLHLGICNESIFSLTSADVTIFSIGGVVLNKIYTNSNEGKIIGMDLSTNYLCIFTMNGYIKAYDVSHHDPRSLFPTKCAYDLFDDFGEIVQVKCNALGTHLALLIANRQFLPLNFVYCWDFERNSLMEISLEYPEGGQDKTSVPISLYWDLEEAQLFAVEIKSMERRQTKSMKSLLEADSIKTPGIFVNTDIWIIFCTEKNQLKILEKRSLALGDQLLRLCIPNIIIINANMIREYPLRDFVDVKDCDDKVRKMVLNFSMHVVEGNMDLAYRCIRSIESKTVWRNLAKMCVNTGRLDVAKVCMGHLQQANSVRAIQQALEDNDLDKDAKTAVLAVELGLNDKVKELYLKSGRFDLLGKYYRASGNINEAIRICETKDRLHLKNAYYHKAKECQGRGDISTALEYYEKTENPVQNVTQLLLQNPTLMQRYMQNTNNSKMLKWWGQYIESSGDMDAALAIYQKADDAYSQVKILCYLGKISKADVIARQSGDRAACYHIARHYENIGKFQEAILFYTRAHTFGNAIRICKENDLQDDLWTVANASRNREKSIAAAYFQECGSFKRAIELYHRAGMLHKATNLAFEFEQPDILENIASELTADSDPELINSCANFFLNIGQYQKAVHLLAKTKQLKQAVNICLDKGVPITENLAEMLSPTKEDSDEETRVFILTKLGELLQQQGDYHAATKKFTQAGDKIRAMKSLLKSGNTEKIIYFANVSRQPEVYIMAANYLQALNWQNNNNILKNIVTFYSKGHAYDSLANFYAICAQIEIDEYHNYEKALKSMHEAAKCLEKLSTHPQQAYINLQRIINDVKIILSIQNSLQNDDNQGAIAACRNMLMKPEQPPIRQADIFVLLIKALANSEQYSEAARVLKELSLKEPMWSTNNLVEKSLVQKIANECNLDFDIIWRPINQSRSHGLDVNTSDDNDKLDQDQIQEELLYS